MTDSRATMERYRADGPSLQAMYLPAAPLLVWLEGRDDLPKSVEKALWRMRGGRITVRQADEICTGLLRTHPSDIYGPAWFEEVTL